MEAKGNLRMTQKRINAFLEAEAARQIGASTLRLKQRYLMRLYDSLPRDKAVTQERIATWKQELEAQGYAQQTVENHIKCVNGYLVFEGRKDLKLLSCRFDDLTGKQFGNLTVLEPTRERKRRYCVWRCRCSCGKEKNVSSGDLVSGNTTSCGCKRIIPLMENNWYFEGTELRQALEERVESSHASSGYTGVTLKRNKWMAYITYKKKRYYLGSYDRLEDAVKARARAKAFIKKDAQRILEKYKGQGCHEGKKIKEKKGSANLSKK